RPRREIQPPQASAMSVERPLTVGERLQKTRRLEGFNGSLPRRYGRLTLGTENPPTSASSTARLKPRSSARRSTEVTVLAYSGGHARTRRPGVPAVSRGAP